MALKILSKVIEAKGDTLKCRAHEAFLGQQCLLVDKDTYKRGEVYAIEENGMILIKLLEKVSVERGATVHLLDDKFFFPMIENEIFGKVIDCYGTSIYGQTYSWVNKQYHKVPVEDLKFNLEDRSPIGDAFATGVKVIDSMFTIGVGQRMGLFAPAGAGKTTTMSIMANNMQADVVIFAMIGERAREVVEFVEGEIGEAVLKKSITIVSTSDANPLEKVRTGLCAVAIAQHFRSKGKKVVLFMDSLTRFARAKAMLDETPITGGVPLGVSNALASLVESSGNAKIGSITGIFTILIEGEIDQDPIAHEVKSLIDGHLVLSSKVAATGRYPAVEILKSKSRIMPKLVPAKVNQASDKLKDMLNKYLEVELLIRVGEYKFGEDKDSDEAVNKYKEIMAFCTQGFNAVPMEEAHAQLCQIAAIN